MSQEEWDRIFEVQEEAKEGMSHPYDLSAWNNVSFVNPGFQIVNIQSPKKDWYAENDDGA